MKNSTLYSENIVGLIPAAGKATRLGKIPFSKELFPIGFEEKEGDQRPKTVSSYLIDQMADAGIKSIHYVIRKDKWDIPNYYGGGKEHNISICYQIADYSYCVPFSINQAYPFIKDKTIALGFPDIIIKPRNVFNQLIKKLNSNVETDFVLGMFPSNLEIIKDEMDIIGNRTKNHYLNNKKDKNLNFTWIIAIWRPTFTKFLNKYLENLVNSYTETELLKNECQLSDILAAAISNDLISEYVFFENGDHIDIGIAERLVKARTFL